jgi:hypothetical protein
MKIISDFSKYKEEVQFHRELINQNIEQSVAKEKQIWNVDVEVEEDQHQTKLNIEQAETAEDSKHVSETEMNDFSENNHSDFDEQILIYRTQENVSYCTIRHDIKNHELTSSSNEEVPTGRRYSYQNLKCNKYM